MKGRALAFVLYCNFFTKESKAIKLLNARKNQIKYSITDTLLHHKLTKYEREYLSEQVWVTKD